MCLYPVIHIDINIHVIIPWKSISSMFAHILALIIQKDTALVFYLLSAIPENADIILVLIWFL